MNNQDQYLMQHLKDMLWWIFDSFTDESYRNRHDDIWHLCAGIFYIKNSWIDRTWNECLVCHFFVELRCYWLQMKCLRAAWLNETINALLSEYFPGSCGLSLLIFNAFTRAYNDSLLPCVIKPQVFIYIIKKMLWNSLIRKTSICQVISQIEISHLFQQKIPICTIEWIFLITFHRCERC